MKKNEIVPFGYDDQLVRTVMVDNVPWFVAKDVCAALELTNPTEALRVLDEDEKNTLRISEGIPNRGNPNMNIISESGLYTLILRSNKAEAKRFRKWVTSEVLPNIRKNGIYDITGELAELKRDVAELKKGQNKLLNLPPPEDTHSDILRFGGKFLEITGKGADYVEARVLWKLFFSHIMTVSIGSKRFFDELSYVFPEVWLDSSRKNNPVFRGCMIK